MSERDAHRRQALIDLLALPDDPDVRRGHHRTVDGLPGRFTMIGVLAARFIQQHLLEQEERAAVSDSPPTLSRPFPYEHRPAT